MTFTGPDVSGHQGVIDLRAARNAGHSFVIIKATEGTSYINPYLGVQVASARAAGLKVGLYHFMDAGNGSPQARHFLATVKGLLRDGDLGLWADFEAAPNGNPSHADLHAFLAVADAGAPRPLGIYSGLWYWQPHGSSSCGDCGSRPLWLSAYSSRAPTAPRPWRSVALWQFTDKDTSTGTSLDMSRTDDLAALTGTIQEDDMFSDDDRALLAAVKYALVPEGGNTSQGEVAKLLREAVIDLRVGGKAVDPAVLAGQVVSALGPAFAAELVTQIGQALAAAPSA